MCAPPPPQPARRRHALQRRQQYRVGTPAPPKQPHPASLAACSCHPEPCQGTCKEEGGGGGVGGCFSELRAPSVHSRPQRAHVAGPEGGLRPSTPTGSLTPPPTGASYPMCSHHLSSSIFTLAFWASATASCAPGSAWCAAASRACCAPACCLAWATLLPTWARGLGRHSSAG